MKSKKIISGILGLFILLSIATLAYKSSSSSAQQKSNSNSPESKALTSSRIDAFYFHGTARCYTCNTMEKYIRETLDSHFASQVKNGKINFQSINVESDPNNHYIQDYKLYTKSFILSLKSEAKEKEWLNCDKIWKLARDEASFKQYIKTEVEKYLGML